MITNISNVNVPFDVMYPILVKITDSLLTLKAFMLVSKGFKATVENSLFLHSFLLKYKGNRYSDDIYAKEDARKFLVLDRDITQAFMTIISKNSSSTKIMICPKVISSIALRDLKLGIFKISHNSKMIYFRFSKTEIETLKNINFNEHNKWKECIENMANRIANYDFPVQIKYHLPENISYLKQIESAFLNPNEKMKALIKDYEITDVFFGKSSLLLINAHKGKDLEKSKLQEVVLEPEEHNRLLNSQLIHECIEQVNFIIQDNNISFKLNLSMRNQILARLQDHNSGQKGYIEQHFIADPCKFLFGIIFPEIWPNNLRELGSEKCKNSFNYWLVRKFSNSINVIVREQENGKADVKCDSSLRKYMTNTLKNPSSGLKIYIEETCKDDILSLYKDLLFWEIWHSEPFDPAKTVRITLISAKKS